MAVLYFSFLSKEKILHFLLQQNQMITGITNLSKYK